MNLELVCEALRNPVGLPSHPVIFLILLVLTWTMHIMAVFVMLGSTALSLFGAFNTSIYWQKLSKTSLIIAKFAVGLAIVLGVAPLLFVQTLYDQWYVSNVLSARWAIGFIVILLVAYYALYHRYFASKYTDGTDNSRWSLVLSLALLLLAGFIMHVLTSQMLKPEMWTQWYAPNGHTDPSGSKLHDYNIWRYLYFIGLSLPVTGCWLLAKKTYLTASKSASTGYLQWMDELSRKLMHSGGALSVLFYLMWMKSLAGNSADFTISIGSFVGLLATVMLAVIPSLIPKEKIGYGAIATASVAVFLIAIARESLRISTLHKACHYNVLDYPVHFDGYSTVLFLGSLVFLAVPVLSYFIALAWQVGKSEGVYIASPAIEKLGQISLIVFGLWFAQYFLFGLITIM